MLLTSGVNFGFYRTIPHLSGVVLGFGFLVLCVGFGLGSLFTAFPQLHLVLKVVGGLYLLYLAWRIATTTTISNASADARPMSFMEASLFQWVNPKAWAMAITAVTVYTSTNSPLWSLSLVIAVFLSINMPCVVLWTGFGTAFRRFLENPRVLRWFNRTMGILLVLSIIPMIG